MLTHLEFEQIKRALDRLRSAGSGNGYSDGGAVKREDVTEILLPFVDGFTPPNPHPAAVPAAPVQG